LNGVRLSVRADCTTRVDSVDDRYSAREPETTRTALLGTGTIPPAGMPWAALPAAMSSRSTAVAADVRQRPAHQQVVDDQQGDPGEQEQPAVERGQLGPPRPP
jgi:hypothetical protein